MKKSRFYFGQHVTVKAFCEMVYRQPEGDGLERLSKRLQRTMNRIECEPFQGFIVGARYRRNGEIHPGSMYGGFEGDDYEQPYLIVKGSTLVWLVARSITGKHIDVLDGDVQESGQIHYNAPWTNPRPKQEWPGEWRRILSEEAKRAKRDSKGRFLKYQPPSTPQVTPQVGVEGVVANGNEAKRSS